MTRREMVGFILRMQRNCPQITAYTVPELFSAPKEPGYEFCVATERELCAYPKAYLMPLLAKCATVSEVGLDYVEPVDGLFPNSESMPGIETISVEDTLEQDVSPLTVTEVSWEQLPVRFGFEADEITFRHVEKPMLPGGF